MQESDYKIPDGRVVAGSPESRAKRNLEAIRVMRACEEESRSADAGEKETLAAYVGWGAVPQIFAANKPEWQAAQADLKTLLAPEEYEHAQRSTTNSHYTSALVVDAIWRAMRRLGMKPGMKWIEPALGVGNFFGRQPAALRSDRRFGVEKDTVTGKIARLLYPESTILIQPFEEARLLENYFDAAISNVPFGDFGVYDAAFASRAWLTRSIHNYFFVKALELVRPGGLIAFITSRYTLDAYSPESKGIRGYLAERADLLGAIRLPDTAFRECAGTSVVADILFLRKRLPGAEPAESASWREAKYKFFDRFSNVGQYVNEYFSAVPGSILGTENQSRGQYSRMDYTVSGELEAAALDRALDAILPKGAMQPWEPECATRPISVIDVAGRDEKIGGLFFERSKLYRRVSDSAVEIVAVDATTRKRIAGQLEIRDALLSLLDAERSDEGEDDLDGLRGALNTLYDRYVRAFGALSKRVNQSAMDGDPDAPLLLSLERDFDPISGVAGKSAIFEHRVIEPVRAITSVGSAKESLMVSLNETGGIDFERMCALTGLSAADLQAELTGLIYEDPRSGSWLTAEEYLSGRVRTKLKEAQAAEAVDVRFAANSEALAKVLPEDIPPSQIIALLGVTWVPLTVYGEFISHVMNTDHTPKVHYINGEFRFEASWVRTASKWATADVTAYELLKETMNLRRIKVYKEVDGSTVIDRDATLAARDRQGKLNEYFTEWLLATDDARTSAMTRLYNDRINDLRLRTYDGSHLTLPGMSRACLRSGDLEPYQKSAVWRQVCQRNCYLAHAVGAGKAQPLDAKLVTPTGYKYMGEMRPGDLVIASDGTPTVVEAVYPQGEKDIFRVEFSDGSSTECCDEHLWLTQTYSERNGSHHARQIGKTWTFCKPKVRTLREIQSSLIAPHRGAKNHSIPMVGAVQFDRQDVPLHPYLMGVLLGDGCFRHNGGVTVSTADKELLEMVKSVLPVGCEIRFRKGYDFAICKAGERSSYPNPIVEVLKDFQLYGQKSEYKFAPACYLHNEVDVRLAFLQGLMDTDGNVSRRGTAVTFSSTSLRLIVAVKTLVQSLGGIVSGQREKHPKYQYNGEDRTGKLAYEIHISLPPDINPFRLPRKANAVSPKSKYKPIRYITAIVPVGRKPAQCIRVAHPSRLYVTDEFIVTHNTFEGIAGAMELKRLGLISRPLFVVPNQTLGGWQQQFQMLYPGARVIVFSERDLEKERRQQTIARIATSSWDAVVIPHSSFQLIPVGPEMFKAHYGRLRKQLEDSIEDARSEGMDSRFIKRLEKQKERLLVALKKRQTGAKDKTVTWEQLAVDYLFVDEAHEYKRLGFSTKQMQVAGIDPNGNQKTFDLLMKVRHVQKYGRGVVFASGTPVTNTMGELYNVMQYLIQPELDARGLGRFDEWAAAFGQVVEVFEPKPEGGGYQVKGRFARFVNVPELAQLFRSFADVLTSDMLAIPRPELAGGERQSMVNQLSAAQRYYMQALQSRAAKIRQNARKALPDNMLAIYGDAQLMALEVRMVMPQASDSPESRLNQAADEIASIWRSSAGSRGVQLVFSDFGKPAAFQRNGFRRFSAYDALMEKLQERGVPSEQIAHIYEARNKHERARLFLRVNAGEIRVLLGSTPKMGIGVNVQERVTAMHHLTLPHRPSDLEQREGRGLRQGNRNKAVDVKYYITKGSLDELKFANVARKARAFAQFMQGAATVREMEDIDDLAPSLEAFQAAASGDPRVRRKLEVDNELLRLSALQSAWRDERWLRRRDLNEIPQRIARCEQQIQLLSAIADKARETGRVWTIGHANGTGKTFTGKGIQTHAGIALEAALRRVKPLGYQLIGYAHGVSLEVNGLHWLRLGGAAESIDVKDRRGPGVIQSVEHFIRNLGSKIKTQQESIARAAKDREELEAALAAPWTHEEQAAALRREQAELFAALGGGKGEAAAVVSEDQEVIDDAQVEAVDLEEEEIDIPFAPPALPVEPPEERAGWLNDPANLRLFDPETRMVLVTQ